jgi:hypothetical protein
VGLLEEALERTVARGLVHQHALIVVWLGEAALALGRPAEAERKGSHALRLSRDNGEHGHEGWALQLLGDVWALSEPSDAGRGADFYRRALALGQDRGMRPLVAHAHLGLGRLTASGRREARGHLEAALAMFREMDMPPWRVSAEAGLAR